MFFGPEGDSISQIVWFLMFIVFIFVGPRLMVTQTIFKLEKEITEIEQLAVSARNYVSRKANKKAGNSEKIKNFMEFFAVTPVSSDPYGIIKKIEHVIRQSDERFKWFVNDIAPGSSEIEKANLKAALSGAITANQIAKVLRHLLETVKKHKMFQMAIILQMQIPLIKELAEAAEKATEAFVRGEPIGDSIGPLIAASKMKKGKVKVYTDHEFALGESTIAGRKVLIAKASGPGATVGIPGRFLENLSKRNKISRIITVDAGLRLEGEKTGSVAEGIGVAMGGDVDRYQIEEFAVRKKIPLDAIVIKQTQKEALTPLNKDILNSIPKAESLLRTAVRRAKKSDKILVIGVGNTSGVGNTDKEAEKAVKVIKKKIKKMEAAEKAKKKKWF